MAPLEFYKFGRQLFGAKPSPELPATDLSVPPKSTPRARAKRTPATTPVSGRNVRVTTAKATARSLCPVNLTLELIGDSWSMLIIRDMMLRGHKGYQAFLKSGEGIATNILSDRLNKLEQNGLISKAPDPADARRFIYSLTDRGADLAPILVEMALYSARYEPRADMPKEILQDMQRNRLTFAAKLAKTHTPPVKKPKAAKKATRKVEDETLSLFDDL